MKIIQKAALLLALVLLLSTAAFAAAITTTTETIGGAAAQVVYVTPSANTEIRAIIANGQLGTTAEAEAVVVILAGRTRKSLLLSTATSTTAGTTGTSP